MNSFGIIDPLEAETDYIEFNGQRYCPYCGERIIGEDVLNDHSILTLYNCHCPDAKQAQEINIKINNLKRALPPIKYHLETKLCKIDN